MKKIIVLGSFLTFSAGILLTVNQNRNSKIFLDKSSLLHTNNYDNSAEIFSLNNSITPLDCPFAALTRRMVSNYKASDAYASKTNYANTLANNLADNRSWYGGSQVHQDTIALNEMNEKSFDPL